MNKVSLPVGFERLTPFVDVWNADSSAERARLRDMSDEAGRAAFYSAAIDLIPAALDYLDGKSLNNLDPSELKLMQLVLSFAHVSMAIELQREDEPKHAKSRAHMQITRAPADEPAEEPQ